MNIDTHQFEPNFISASNFLFNTGNQEIDQLNLNRIIVKAMDENTGLGWEQVFTEEVSVLYRVFLFLCKMYPQEIIVPTKEVDEFWHLHILDTQNYHLDCQQIFGHYLHHFPYAGLEGTNVPKSEEEKYLLRTLELVTLHFPEVIEEN